jgi:nucleoside-diphosphate-sugar epimerase
MTVSVRPGKPNGAASSFFSGIIREPLAGVESVCPVDASVSHPVSSPGTTINSLIAVFEANASTLGNRLALNLPSVTVTVQQMLDALEKVAGAKVRARVSFEREERIAAIVSNWARGASSERALQLGLRPDASFEDIVRQYIEDCRRQPGYPENALQGL